MIVYDDIWCCVSGLSWCHSSVLRDVLAVLALHHAVAMKVGRNSRCLNIQVFGASLGHWKIWKQGLLRFQSLLSLLLHFQETHESHEQQALYSLPESTFYRVPPSAYLRMLHLWWIHRIDVLRYRDPTTRHPRSRSPPREVRPDPAWTELKPRKDINYPLVN